MAKYGNIQHKHVTGFKQIFDEAKHPRGHHGEFEHTAGSGVPAILNGVKGKTPPKSFKFYKSGYKPKPVNHTAMQHGKSLYELKKAGHLTNDYEFWLAAGKIAAAHNKKHATQPVTPHGVVNAAFHHEIADTGGLNIGGAAPIAPAKHVHGKTSTGIGMVSKHAPPGTLTKYIKTMPGASGAQLWVDDKGQEWLVKGNKPGSNAYGVKFAVALEEALAKIQNKAGLRSATSHKTTLDGKEVLAQKMFGDVHQAFTDVPDITKMTDSELLDMQKQQIFDWVISNFDTHTGNFLEDNDGIIGIDKGQAFKFFGKDKLDWNYVPVTPLGGNKLTYSEMWKQYVSGKGWFMFDFDNSPELETFAHRLQSIPDKEYKKLLEPYAVEAASKGILAGGSMSVTEFLDKAVERKNNVINDFTAFYDKAQAEHDGSNGPPKSAPTVTPKVPESPQVTGDTPEMALLKSYVDKGVITTDEAQKQIHDHSSWTDSQKGALMEWLDVYTGGNIYGGEPTPPGMQPKKPIPDVAGKLALGHTILPTSSGTFSIKKPNGELSKNKDGAIKEWPTAEDALNSSTMVKYKNVEVQQAHASMAGSIAAAQAAPNITPGDELNFTQSADYIKLKAKIAAGEAHTPEEYTSFKTYIQKITNSKKAAGAAELVDDLSGLGFHVSMAPPAKAKKSGFKETPKFKLKGGSPPSLDKAKGPNAITLGQKLWDMKKSGKITTDYEMWNEANKLANADKKQALAGNASAQVGEHYSSKNSIRNAAMRLEFDETGDVTWETSAEKTSETIGQTLSEIKHVNELHVHVPVVTNSGHQASQWANATAKSGSYDNPHCFSQHDSSALRDYGYKYTSHSGWNADQKSAWYDFSGSSSGSINTFFRTGDVGAYGSITQTKKQAKVLVDAFKSDNVKPLEDWTIVTRGTSGGWELGLPLDKASFEELKTMEGKVVRNKCPVSTSLATMPAMAGGAVWITYKLPPGFRGLGIYGKSKHPSENEMILPPGMAYKIHEVKHDGNKTQVLVEVVDVKLPEIT